MSIHEMLQQLEGEGKLVRYLPPDGVAEKRMLLMTQSLRQEIFSRRSATAYFGQTRWILSAFDRWVSGSEVTVRWSGRQGGGDLALLEPPPEEIWEFRIVQPQPQMRVFARFVARDVVIAMACHNRDALGPARRSRDRRSKAWLEAMYECESAWTRIFGGTRPLRGSAIGDYISENAWDCT